MEMQTEKSCGLDVAALIMAAQKGDLEAFNQLVLKFQDQMFNYVVRMLDDPDLAEDVVQNVFISAYLNLPKFRYGSFRSWLYRIATNACYDELRRRKRHPMVPIEHEDSSEEYNQVVLYSEDTYSQPETMVERSEFAGSIQQALNRLDVDHRAVVELVDLLEFDYIEAAQVLKIPVGTLKSRLFRARMRLRDLLSTNLLLPTESGVSLVYQCM